MFYLQSAENQGKSGSGASLFASAVAVFAVLGATTVVCGLMFVRNAVTQALDENGRTFSGIDQSYSYDGVRGPRAYTAGSSFSESSASRDPPASKCIVVCAAAFENTER